jgi:peptidoglycan/LPS O-acetylase OafA/YrhL
MAFHAQIRACGGGFIGVDVFFVLSGYLITGLLRHEIVRKNSIDLTMFYSRRLRRLLPASTVMVLGSAFVSSVLLPPLEQSRLAMSSFATLTYLSNVYFAIATEAAILRQRSVEVSRQLSINGSLNQCLN